MPTLVKEDATSSANRHTAAEAWATVQDWNPAPSDTRITLDPSERTPRPSCPGDPGALHGSEVVLPSTCEHPLELQSRFQNQLHAQVQKIRGVIIDALWGDEADEQLRKRARSMGWCCARPSIRSHATGPRPSLARCRDRLCPLCSRLRGTQAAARTAAIVQKFNAPRFVTLTQAHREAPLKDQVDALLSGIRKLRESKLWKHHVAGGVQAIEVTYRKNTDRWHVHAHLVVTGTFLPQPQLKAEWLRVTGDSQIVDIRAVHDRTNAANYVAKYVAKPIDAETWPPSKLREYAHAMHGRRLLQPFGSAFKIDLDDDEDDAVEQGTEHVCHADQFQKAVEQDIPEADVAAEIFSRLGVPMAAIVLRPHARGFKPVRPSEPEVRFAVAVAYITGHTPEHEWRLECSRVPRPPVAGDPPCRESHANEPPSSASASPVQNVLAFETPYNSRRTQT